MNAAQRYITGLKADKSIRVWGMKEISAQETIVVYIDDAKGIKHTVELDNDDAEILSHETEEFKKIQE